MNNTTQNSTNSTLCNCVENTQFNKEQFLNPEGKSQNFPQERTRYRMFHFSFYCNPERFNKVIAKASHYIWIYHDKDDSEAHYHLIVEYTEARTLRAVMRDFDDTDFTEDTNIKVTVGRDRKALANYLIHESQECLKDGKHLYSKNEVHCDNMVWWYCTHYRQKEEASDFVTDLLECKLTHREMAYKYGRDYIRNAHNYRGFVTMANQEDRKNEKKEFIQALHESIALACKGQCVEVEMNDIIYNEYIPTMLAQAVGQLMHKTGLNADTAIRQYMHKLSCDVYDLLTSRIEGIDE